MFPHGLRSLIRHLGQLALLDGDVLPGCSEFETGCGDASGVGTGGLGTPILVFPRPYRTIATWLLYERPTAVEWNDRFSDGVRLIGALSVRLAILALKNRRTE